MEVCESLFGLFVEDQFGLGLGNGIESEIIVYEVVGVVGGGIIDDEYLVVGVVLGEDGVQIAFDAKICVVVEGGDNDAEGSGLFLREVVLVGESFVLLCPFLSLLGRVAIRS